MVRSGRVFGGEADCVAKGCVDGPRAMDCSRRDRAGLCLFGLLLYPRIHGWTLKIAMTVVAVVAAAVVGVVGRAVYQGMDRGRGGKSVMMRMMVVMVGEEEANKEVSEAVWRTITTMTAAAAAVAVVVVVVAAAVVAAGAEMRVNMCESEGESGPVLAVVDRISRGRGVSGCARAGAGADSQRLPF